MRFSKAQETAICHKDGPMMVLAGPGSGKTTVITERVRYLTEKGQIPPGDILVITFTKAAALEMKERYEALIGQTTRVAFGTFHAIFFRILKLAYHYSGDQIVREEEQAQMIRELTHETGMEPEDENEFISSVLSEISAVKGELLDLNHYYSKNCPDEIFRKIYLGYEERMRRAGRLDFDDMMVMCLELFRQRKDILAAWQRRYRYILIDEFQDINRLQYEIIRMMAEPERNLFIVGDDDQSIYRFRGARPELMLGFEKDYPGAVKVLLDLNYRCTPRIAEPALRLVSHNQKRFVKAIRTAKASGGAIITRIWQDPPEETRRIAEELQALLKAGCSPKEIAVLYRTNAEPRLLMEKLMEYNLPFCTRDRVPNLYEHWISQNILTYIRLALGSRKREDFFQIMNRPARYISRDALKAETFTFRELMDYYREKDWIADRIESLEYDLKALSRMSPLAAVNYIRQGMGYDSYLESYAALRRMKPEELLQTANELLESAAEYADFASWFAHMEEYREELQRQSRRGKSEQEAVTLSTMHSAKGLEFRIVYILDAVEGVTPHSKALLEEDLEEERRLFYVAMTRAKERLHVYGVRERYHKKVERSRFIGEYLGEE